MTFTPERSCSHPAKTTIGIQTEKLPVDLTCLNVLNLLASVNLFLCDCDLMGSSLLCDSVHVCIPCTWCMVESSGSKQHT